MTATLNHIIEPLALLLVWQSTDESASLDRTRRVVGKITCEKNGAATLSYLVESDDFQAAIASGFKGYPGFSTSTTRHTSVTVMEAMMRRLPPRKREDFADYLAVHRLPNPFNYSDLALLAYTEARLPSDGFSTVAVFDPTDTPCEFILEVAGARYYKPHVDELAVGDAVTLNIEHTNPIEPGAIAIFHNENKIGYVNRALIATITSWLSNKEIRAIVDRKSGSADRPLLYVHLLIT